MSASFVGGRALGLLGALVICTILWAPIVSPYQVAATVQAIDRAIGFTHEVRSAHGGGRSTALARVSL
jgi:hypothetical protein